MSNPRAAGPRVYAAISAVMAELARTGIAKSQFNSEKRYAFRGIDNICKALAPLLARQKLCILPRVLKRSVAERDGANGMLLISVSLKVAFDFVSAKDGSMHSIEAYGEALDDGDKATAKAMSAAYKHAMIQAFCIPVPGTEDADASAHHLTCGQEQPDPVQGWDRWWLDILDLVESCVSEEAVIRVQTTYRDLLRAASKRRPDLYAAIGRAVAGRREALAGAATPSNGQARPTNGSTALEAADHV